MTATTSNRVYFGRVRRGLTLDLTSVRGLS